MSQYLFFCKLMKIASIRRCVFDEKIENDENKIYTVYSGELGCLVKSVEGLLDENYLK